jgi:hypothetical protein
VWVETEEDCDPESTFPWVMQIAKVIQPFPVAVINVTTDTIISVNDFYYVTTTARSQPQTHGQSWTSSPQPQPGASAPATYGAAEASLPQSQTSRETPPTQSIPVMHNVSEQVSTSATVPRLKRTPTPPNPPDTDSGSPLTKFVGILRLDDSELSQTVKITYGLGVSSSPSKTHATTTTTIHQPQINLPASTIALPKPALQCTHFTLGVWIDQEYINDIQCQLTDQEPKMHYNIQCKAK